LVHLRYTAMPGEHALHQRIAGRFDLRVHKRCYLLKLGQARQYLAAKRHHRVLRERERGFATHQPSRLSSYFVAASLISIGVAP
jgi:hypothetical protein